MANPLFWTGTKIAAYVEEAMKGAGMKLDDDVTETSEYGVKSSGIWTFVKGLLPSWLTSTYAEPATTEALTTGLATKENTGVAASAVATHNAATDAHSALFDKKVDKATGLALSALADASVDTTSSTSVDKLTITRNDGEADVTLSVPKKDTSLEISGAYADAKTVGDKLSLRATVADLGNGVFRIADEAVDTTTTKVLY